MSLAAALAAASHHSAQQYVAPRGQKPATQSREGEVHEKRDCLRAQKRPLPGTPPEPLEEVAEMQGAAVTVGYVAVPVPLLVVPSMAGGDGVDGTTTKWLLKVAEGGGGAGGEEEEREEGGEELLKRLQGIVHRAASLLDLTSSSSSGRRRKRKKPKLPKSSSSGCPRLCALQRQVPAFQGVRVESASGSVHRRPLHILVVQQRQVRGLMVQKTVVLPQLQFIASR